jgi:hypothetical protein
MLASFFGKKSDHPLANLKSAQQMLELIPKTDAIKALEELASWVESLRDHSSAFSFDHQVTIMSLLDEAAQTHVRKLQREYFTLLPLNQFQENRLWSVLNTYFILCEQVYADIFAQCRNADRGIAFPRPQMSQLASRSLFVISNRLKFAAVRYEQIDPALWTHLAAIYSYSGKFDFLEETVFLYPGSGLNTSPKREFAELIVWYSMGTGSLAPLHIHIAERLISYLNKFLEVGTHVSEGCLWAFNLLQPTAPMRVSGEGTIHPSVRFIGIGGLEAGLNDLIRTLAKGVVPQEINMYGSIYDTELLGDVARQLMTRCVLPPPTRKNARRKLKVNLHVSNGLKNLFENSEAGLGFSEAESEIWEVEDVSSTGFRSVVSPALLGSVKIGSLIGSKPENMLNWGVGIVRRLSRDAQNNLQVGVEILSNQVIGVGLKAADRSGAAEPAHMAMYLNKLNDNSGEAWLLMSPGTYLPSRSFNMRLSGKNYLLLTLELVESGDDYDLARYRKMEQDTSE